MEKITTTGALLFFNHFEIKEYYEIEVNHKKKKTSTINLHI